jgi:hypothetical protein
MPRLQTHAAALAIVLAALAACGGDRETPEQREVHRAACIADELALQAKVRLANLDTALAQSRGTPLEPVTTAGHTFATAYATFANQRLGEAAYLDSAAHVREDEDSTRYARKAAQYRPAAPAAGTVESNAIDRWRQDFTSAAGNPSHPCNNLEQEEDG